MKTAVKSGLKSKPFCIGNSFFTLREKETCFIDYKSYQKLFVVLIALSTILIFSESPRDMEKICLNYNSKELCNVW
tara:strand:- start:109 stop:336 length:228 start_codon:yes stop_codon:yes gene_type:complete